MVDGGGLSLSFGQWEAMISVTFKNIENDSLMRFEWRDGIIHKWYNNRQSPLKTRLATEPENHREFEDQLRHIYFLSPKWELWQVSKPPKDGQVS